MASDEADRDYQAQLALLAQWTKKSNGEGPDPALESSKITGRVGNLYVDGSLICQSCLDILWSTDKTLLEDLSGQVHVPIPEDSNQGPDLWQCFCGYFCFNRAGLEAHFELHPRDEEAFAAVLQRAERIKLHDACRAKLLAAVQ